MASILCSGLCLDNADLCNKVVFVCEENHCDSSFLMTCLIWKGLIRSNEKVQTNVCFLSLHNSQEHYENIAVKLGLNILNYIKKGSVVFLDGPKYINNYFNSDDKQLDEIVSSEFCKQLFLMLKEKVDALSQNSRNNVYVLIDDISDLLSAGFTLRSVLLFLKYCRTLMSDKGVTLIFGTYLCENDVELNILCNSWQRISDYYITVSGLKTGFSSDVTGGINIVEKVVNEFGYNEYKKDSYHFKFSDRQVKIFYPGSIQ